MSSFNNLRFVRNRKRDPILTSDPGHSQTHSDRERRAVDIPKIRRTFKSLQEFSQKGIRIPALGKRVFERRPGLRLRELWVPCRPYRANPFFDR